MIQPHILLGRQTDAERMPDQSPWIDVPDGTPEAMELFRRHYSFNRRRDQMSLSFCVGRNRNAGLFVGPGEKLVLLLPGALFIWRKFRRADGQQGVNCAAFRNESPVRASELILAAEVHAWDRWPGERLYTYVNDRRIRKTRTPGRCFLKAGWRYVRDSETGKPARTKWNRLLILEKLAQADDGVCVGSLGAGRNEHPQGNAEMPPLRNGEDMRP